MIGALARSLRRGSFRHGIHPRGNKHHTEHLPVARMPFVDRYLMPLSQHAGAPARPVVRAGERVTRGQVIAEPGGFVSSTLHSPVTGRVAALGPAHHPNGRLVDAIEIEADPFASQRWDAAPIPWRELADEEFVAQVQRAGLVGMGGAAFPSHVKYKPLEGKPIRRLVANGAECEPYLTADHRTMVERPEAVLRGIEIVATRLGVEEVAIGVELNKTDAIEALGRELGNGHRGEIPIRVVPLKVKYPQGAEKMLIDAIYGVEVPAGGLPLDVGTLVNNVGTMAAIADYFDRGQPLIERVVTVAGPGVERPANLLVPVGTPVRKVFEHCGGLLPETREVVMGGPMMGMPLASLDVPVLKATGGILVLSKDECKRQDILPCIRCGKCVDACPVFLNPQLLGSLARVDRYEEMVDANLHDCMLCGCCSFVCPSNIPLSQLFAMSKIQLSRLKAA